MGKKPDDGKNGKRKDRHKPTKQIRLSQRLARQLKEWARQETERTGSPVTVTDAANVAVREFLEKAGLWPSGG